MPHVSMSATKSDTVPFNLFSLTYAVRRNFLDHMPLKDLHVLRKESDRVKSLSNFRGVIVSSLKVVTDTVGETYYGYTRFSELKKQRFNTTPLQLLDVHMGPDIEPDALLSKMEGQHYSSLFLTGNYDWKTVVALLHAGVEVVGMYGNVNLPTESIEEFFKTLIFHKVKSVCIHTENYDPTWLFVAEKIFNNTVGVTVKTSSFPLHSETVVTGNNVKINIRVSFCAGNVFIFLVVNE